ncbi:hypothetical protein [Flavobacterium pallidum]|uniref:Uncharacterized protein n=1 Tax=Flavobacterium pallidum TaxID=2172098 RepID=A0A2S1SKA4_9FLAO|nr:hypothetical protein [Flavobacterium pallidum]AWI26854.1 hypothetical protein HYN49_13615 [Flavobacterium pallidum]
MKLTKSLFFILILFITVSCFEKNSNEANEVFELWSGNLPNDIEVRNGKYWRSSHFTYEYIVYLDFQATENWIEKFKKQNSLEIQKSKTVNLPSDAPIWFLPKPGFTFYCPKGFN